MPKTPPIIQWMTDVEPYNYPAAISYLSLVLPVDVAKQLVGDFERTPVSKFNAKDVFRTSGLSLLGVSNSHVERDREKIRKEKPLSPILLVRDVVNRQVIIADGYHRLCAVYSFTEDTLIHCKIVDFMGTEKITSPVEKLSVKNN